MDSAEESVEDSEVSSADEDDLPDSWREVPGQWIYVRRLYSTAYIAVAQTIVIVNITAHSSSQEQQ